MNWKTGNIDMLHGPLTGKLLWFTLPIALSSILQQLFNAADTAIVGRFASADALAAVGTNTEVIALIVTVSSGLGLGANILVARRIGQGRTDEIPAATQTAILLSVLVGFLGLLAGQAAAGPLLRLIQTPEDIFPSALLYLRLYLLGYPFLLLYDFGSAVLRAHGDSRFPFWALALSGLANVVLNLFFVLVCSMGVAGVAVATDISTALSALLVLGRLSKTGSLRRPRLSPALVGEILATGVPSAVQGAVFCFANLFVQASVNPFGETAIAGNTIAMSFEYITLYHHRLRPDGHHLHLSESRRRAAGPVQAHPVAVPGTVHPVQLPAHLHHRPLPGRILRSVLPGGGSGGVLHPAHPLHSALRAPLQSV